VPMAPRCGTPARPKTSRGDLEELQGTESMRPCTPGVQASRSARPCTPMAKNLSDRNDEDVVVTTPQRKSQASAQDSSSDSSSSSSSSSSNEAGEVEMACDSPGLGNTGAAKELLAHAVDLALGSQVATASSGADVKALEQVEGSDGDGDSLEVAPASTTHALGNTQASNVLGDTLASNALGNTAAAQQLCDDAISAAVGSAVNAVAFNTTSGTVDDVEMGGTMNFGGTVGTMRATMGESRPMAMTLGATGDVPPVAPGEEFPGDCSLPATPVAQGTTALLRAALGSSSDDEEGEPLSPTLMSICYEQSPTWRDLNSSLGDYSPSIILVDDTHWTPCKPLPRQEQEQEAVTEVPPMCSPSPCSPPAPRSKRQARKERPVRCCDPEPLSARGHERHAQEMAALGLPVGGRSPALRRPSRPQGGVRHIAVAGGA